ncbi:MAG: DUF4185 domain-containing protein [Acholeplasmataceae bacterium]|jgi:hypothetical protein|nr:DUF4185 domain-containing protein [Acholeplasmataceae bacterium]
MKKGDLISVVSLIKGKNEIKLDRIYPIMDFRNENHSKVLYMIDDEVMKEHVTYANQLIIHAYKPEELSLFIGEGYVAVPEEDLTSKFISHSKWSGGDGIYSFNLTDAKDGFDQEGPKKTLFVFGDTFVGTSDPKVHTRFQPHLMPNNSIGILENDKIEFRVNFQSDGRVAGFYKMDERFDDTGTVVTNLTYYDRNIKNVGYLSGYDPKTLEIIFDLHKERYVSHMEFYNYFSEEADYLSKRGLKAFKILGSTDGSDYQLIRGVILERAKDSKDIQKVDINAKYRYYKLSIPTSKGIGNHNDDTFTEGLYGLNLVKFFDHDEQYRDIYATSNSVLLKDPEHSWIWLQDGVIIKDHLYFLPMIVNSDLNQPEGLQFRILGVALFKTPIIDHMIHPEKSMMKLAPLLVDTKTSQFLYGGAILPNTQQAGAKDPDGYIYIYGYKTTLGLRELVVARVKEDDFETFDDWRFYNGETWVTNLLDAKPLLQHVSCEMSVSKLLEGIYKDKYIVVFTYDTNTPYVSFAIGETPWGPFSEPQKIYHTPEQDIFKSTTYTYNAKAHPHLSKSTEILVTYNTNTYNFDHNMSNSLIYRPRWISLKDTTR